MNRITIKDKNGYHIDVDIETVIQRLGVFEDAYENLINSQNRIPLELEELRKQGKEKTVKYKETVTKKLINTNIIMFFERYGINYER